LDRKRCRSGFVCRIFHDGDACMDADTPILPAHIDETVQAIARLHAEEPVAQSPSGTS